MARKPAPPRTPRTCVDCGDEFMPLATGSYPQRCPPCKVERKRFTDAAKARRWREADPDRQRRYQRESYHRTKDNPGRREQRRIAALRKYGLTQEAAEELLRRQGGLCAICGGEPIGPGNRLHVDHDHATGKVRALLCSPCNIGLGAFADDAKRLRAAAKYVEKHH